jgi:hypothetical protein
MTKTKLLEPIHPGEILAEEFMKPLGTTINGYPAILMCRQTGFTASSTGLDPSRRIPRCA